MKAPHVFIVLGLLLLGHEALTAQQDTTAIFLLSLADGTETRGRIVSEDSTTLVFKTLSGIEIRAPRQNVTSLERIEGEWKSGTFYRTDPNRTRLLFAPTARSIPQGSGYFAVYEIFFPMLAVGVTDWFTFSGGMSLLPGASTQLFYLAPKARILHSESVDLAAGVLYMTVPDTKTEGFGIMYAVFTGGTSSVSGTVGLGWGFYGEDVGNAPTFMLGGELQVSESVKLLTENWFPAGADVGLISIGIRFFGEHLAGDFGLITTTESSQGFPFMPWVGFVYNF